MARNRPALDLTAQDKRKKNKDNKTTGGTPHQGANNKGDRRWPGFKENNKDTQSHKTKEEQKQHMDRSQCNFWQQDAQTEKWNDRNTNDGTQQSSNNSINWIHPKKKAGTKQPQTDIKPARPGLGSIQDPVVEKDQGAEGPTERLG